MCSASCRTLTSGFRRSLPARTVSPWCSIKDHWEHLARIKTTLAATGINPDSLPHMTAYFDLLAFLAIAGVTVVLVIGIKESANLNSAIVMVKISIVLVFIGVAGVSLLQHPSHFSANWHPFIPPNEGSFGRYGWSGICRGAAVIFFAYIGFDAVSTAAQEARNPKKDMPIGILGSLVICTILYILVSGLLTGVVPYTALNVLAPCGRHRRGSRGSLGQLPGKARRYLWTRNRNAGDVARPIARVLLDVA